MKHIKRTGSGDNARRMRDAQLRRNKQVRKKDVKEDVTTAKEQTGAKVAGSKVSERKKTEVPKDKSSIKTPPKTEVPKEENKAKVEDKPEAQAQVEVPKSEGLKSEFVDAFAGNLSEEEAKAIGKKTAASLVEIANNGGTVDDMPVLAAHTRNFAKSILNKKMPKASKKEIREAAKKDPEVARAVKLLDTSTAYMKQVVKEEKAQPAAGANGSPQARPNDASGGGGGGDVETPQQPGDGQGPQSPFHLSPEKQAAMMAENNQTMQEISKIYAQMFADMQKAAAQRHQIMQETAIAISDIMMSIYAKRQQSFAKHHAAVLTMLTDAWG